MKNLIAAVIASAFAFGAVSTTFAADVQHTPAQQHHVVKAKKAHKAHKARKHVRKTHAVQEVKAPTMHAVKYHKKHGTKHVRKAAR